MYMEELSKFWYEVLRPIPEPEWSTPNKVVKGSLQSKLRQFSSLDKETTLIVPPQAGHHSNICDFGPNNSLVKTVISNSSDNVYALEWKSATYARRNETIETFIQDMDNHINHINNPVRLIGLCQGGWQSAIYASLYPDKVSSLVLAAAPIDFHAGNSKIQQYVTVLPLSYYEFLVNLGNGIMKGSSILQGFKSLNFFDRYFNDYLKLYNNINDDEYVKRYRRFRDWYEWTQDLPGKFYLEIVDKLFKKNLLIQDKLIINDRKVKLSNISCPLFLIAGQKDDITLEEQLFNIERYVKSKKIKKLTVPAGHIGVFMGNKILKQFWPSIL